MKRYIPRFNPQKMEDKDVLMLATGREKVLELMLQEMKNCLKTNGNQQFILYGPRGIGKSFFTQLIKVSHDQSQEFSKSIFIQFPEEQNNIIFVADIMDMLSTKLEGKNFSSVSTRWEISDQSWDLSKKRLLVALENLKKRQGKYHVFFAMENLQDFIPKLDDIENARLREFLTDFEDITLIGSSLRPDMDNNYNKKLFQAFKKIQLEPWTEQNFVDYYLKQAKSRGILTENNDSKRKVSEHKIRAIAKFSGGSPRIAVILNSLILDDDLISTIDIMNGVIDELTPYYQDLTKDIPQRSKTLFDLLIRLNENITQSELASKLNPPQDQSTIARSFNWLIENYYVTSIKQKKANVKNYYVSDRLYVLYYQTREVMADQKNSFIQTLIEFLTEYYTLNELTDKINNLKLESKWAEQLKAGLSEISRKVNIDFRTFKDLQKQLILARIDILQKLYFSEKYDEYIKTFEELDISNLSPGEYLMAGSAYSSKNMIEKAIEAYEKGIELAKIFNIKFDFTVYYNLGNNYIKIEKLDEALLAYFKAIELNHNFPSSYFNAAIIYGKQNKYEQAINLYNKAIELEPNDFELYFNLGIVLGNINKYEEAIIQLEKAIKINKNNSEIYYNLAFCFEKIGNLKKAEENYLMAIKLNKNELDSYINLGTLYYDSNQFEKGLKIYNRLIEIDPSNADAYVGIGYINAAINHFDESLSAYKKALELSPNHYLANINLGVLFMKMGNHELSIESYLKCIQINPKDSNVYNNLGCEYEELNQFEKAEENYLLALEINDKHEFAKPNLFQLYIKTDNFDKIKGLLENKNESTKNIKILSLELIKLFTNERSNDFNKFLKVYHFINDYNSNLITDFFSILSFEMYKNYSFDLLQDILDEFKSNTSIVDSLNILIKTWEFLLNSKDRDLASLHPDVRLTVEGILGSLN